MNTIRITYLKSTQLLRLCSSSSSVPCTNGAQGSSTTTTASTKDSANTIIPKPIASKASTTVEKKGDIIMPRNVLEDTQTSQLQAENGAIFDKKPFKIYLDENKVYSWCLCGKSKSQPICDGTHKSIFLKIKLRPVRFKVEKSGYYWLCNCKQTKYRPFCDGTHKQQHIQDAVR